MTTALSRIQAELAQFDDDDVEVTEGDLLTARQARLLEEYPEPELGDILTTKDWLEARFADYHNGINGGENNGGRADGAVGVRTMRYGRDETPAKLKSRLSNDVRVRTMLSHQEMENVRAMLSRNPLRIRIPAAGGNQGAKDKSNQETRWANELAPALERRSTFPLMESQDDAQVEGLGGWEVFLTRAYDHIDFDQDEDESDEEYEERIEAELKEAGLPIGVRPLDNLSTRFDTDEEGIYVATIVERKRYRPLYRKLKARMSSDKFKKAGLPHPDDAASSSGGVSMVSNGSLGDEVETIRYYDRLWYAYVVGGTIVEGPTLHGMPGVPIFPTFSHVTSSPILGEKLQGVTYGLAGLELVINDVLTQDADATLTYNRPRPIGVADDKARTPTNTVLNLNQPGMPLLPAGYTIVDAYASFRQNNQGSPLASALLGFWQKNTLNQVATGQAPGGDVSGFAMNLMTQSSIGPYHPLFQSKAKSWGQVIDFIRIMIRDTIGEDVYLATEGTGSDANTVEWLKLGPEDVTEVPAQVTLDPLSDAERVAVAQWLGEGVQKGWVPEEELLRRGYGSPDVEQWYDEIDLDTLRRELRARRIERLIAELDEEEQSQRAAQLVGPDGQPIGAGSQAAGGTPAQPRPSTIGAANAAASRGGLSETIEGQRPARQGLRIGEGPPAGGS